MGPARAGASLVAPPRDRHGALPGGVAALGGLGSRGGGQRPVVFTGSVDDDEMVSILQGAGLAVMPSLEEGFGLPVVEAAACGVPVICSNFTSLPEVLDEPGRAPIPATRRDRYAIDRALTDDEYRQVLLTAGEWAAQRWTWPACRPDLVDGLAELGHVGVGRSRTLRAGSPWQDHRRLGVRGWRVRRTSTRGDATLRRS